MIQHQGSNRLGTRFFCEGLSDSIRVLRESRVPSRLLSAIRLFLSASDSEPEIPREVLQSSQQINESTSSLDNKCSKLLSSYPLSPYEFSNYPRKTGIEASSGAIDRNHSRNRAIRRFIPENVPQPEIQDSRRMRGIHPAIGRIIDLDGQMKRPPGRKRKPKFRFRPSPLRAELTSVPLNGSSAPEEASSPQMQWPQPRRAGRWIVRSRMLKEHKDTPYYLNGASPSGPTVRKSTGESTGSLYTQSSAASTWIPQRP